MRRNNQWVSLPVRELVPGDVLLLQIGNVLPADAQVEKFALSLIVEARKRAT